MKVVTKFSILGENTSFLNIKELVKNI